MPQTAHHDAWDAGRNYDRYMGRWSQLIARAFVEWLKVPGNCDWADIGCGTGALTRTILAAANPRSVVALDPSEAFVTHARQEITDQRAVFKVADAQDLPLADDAVDVAASALALNFVPDRIKALGEMQRITRPGGTIAFYVWDYPGGGMGFIDAFWKAAAALDPAAKALDEAGRFPFCTSAGLQELCDSANMRNAAIRSVEVETLFPDFEAFWHPFSLGAGPAPGYCMSLTETGREKLKAQLRKTLGDAAPIRLNARAWAVSATSA